jgi:hypothetical protein
MTFLTIFIIGLASPDEEAVMLIDRVHAFFFKGELDEMLKVRYIYTYHSA